MRYDIFIYVSRSLNIEVYFICQMNDGTPSKSRTSIPEIMINSLYFLISIFTVRMHFDMILISISNISYFFKIFQY